MSPRAIRDKLTGKYVASVRWRIRKLEQGLCYQCGRQPEKPSKLCRACLTKQCAVVKRYYKRKHPKKEVSNEQPAG